MTVSSTTNRISYSCNGWQKEFPFNFKIFAKTDLIVILCDSEGKETTLTLTTDYTVSAGLWPTGGTVTTVKAYAEENTLVIIREMPPTQDVDYVENDSFPAETHEEGLDRGVMLIQEIIEKLGRMLILAKSSSYFDLSLPDPVASKLLAWKDDLSGIKNVELKSHGDLSVTDYIKTLLDDENASAALTTLGVTTFIKTLLDDEDAATARATLGVPILSLNQKVIEIGDWNMDITVNVQIGHGLTRDKIRQISILIRDDDGNDYYPLDYNDQVNPNDGGFYINQTYVQLFRRVNGIFDHIDFDATSYNRGWITIWYVI